MSLLDTLRSGIKIADSITKPLQTSVEYSKMVPVAGDGYVNRTWPSTVSLKAIVDWKKQRMDTPTGVLQVVAHSVMFLDVAALLAATGSGGMSTEDRITLPDGTTRPINNLSGFLDPGTGKAVATVAILG